MKIKVIRLIKKLKLLRKNRSKVIEIKFNNKIRLILFKQIKILKIKLI